jgi:hypothetical protein
MVLDPLGHRICHINRQDSLQLVSSSLDLSKRRITYPARYWRDIGIKNSEGMLDQKSRFSCSFVFVYGSDLGPCINNN